MDPLRPPPQDAANPPASLAAAPGPPTVPVANPTSKPPAAASDSVTVSAFAASGAQNGTTKAPGQVPYAPRTSFSPTRPPYMPQFTAATQMILKRMRGESTSLSSTLASTVATDRTPINASTYEDVKRRLLNNMNTSSSMTLQLPTPSPSAGLSPVAGATMSMSMPMPASVPRPGPSKMSAIQKVNAGLTASGRPASLSSAKKAALDGKHASTGASGKKSRLSGGGPRSSGVKRKRGKADAEETSSLSSLSDSEIDQTNTTATTPTTTTKSGRQVLKPTTYNPAAMDSATKKRVHYGKRTPGEAMCKLCTRLAFTDSNQIVFCDGCEGAWHQRCHEPQIGPEVISDSNAKWFCSTCLVKKERHSANKKIKIESLPAQAPPPPPPPKFVGWPDRTAGQTRAYLTGLSHAALIDMIMHALELQPGIAIFPNPDSNGSVASTTRSLFAGQNTDGLFTRAEATPNGPVNFIRKVSSANHNGSRGLFLGSSTYRDLGIKQEDEEKVTGYTPFDPEEEDPYGLKKSWPKPGKGPHAKVLFEGDDLLVDKDDFEAFSHVKYDKNGRKVEENGMAV